MASFLLVHSPVVGPSTWRWVAAELEDRGHCVVVPGVSQAVTSRGWEAFVDSVASQAGEEERSVLVGHSGAGPLLPQIVARARQQLAPLVFIDAGIPPEAGDAKLMPNEILEELRAIAHDGTLPRWSEWFGSRVMEELVPDVGQRLVVTADLPRIPLSYFETRVPVRAAWSSAGCGYIRLSEPYAADAAEAALRGWPVIELPGSHLDIVTRPAAIAEAILAIVAQLAGPHRAIRRTLDREFPGGS
jgi:pimeloyl-ACP methyl ester carboxylesterase